MAGDSTFDHPRSNHIGKCFSDHPTNNKLVNRNKAMGGQRLTVGFGSTSPAARYSDNKTRCCVRCNFGHRQQRLDDDETYPRYVNTYNCHLC